MKKRNYDRMIKKVHEINDGPLAYPIIIKKLKPLNKQSNYNSKLREWYGEPDFDIIAETTGVFSAFKESEKWLKPGTFSIHDWKCTINDSIKLDISCVVERADNGEKFEIIFVREYIGENVLGLRPVTVDD